MLMLQIADVQLRRVLRRMQRHLFPRRIVDDLGPIGDGVTVPHLVRADDGLVYVAKDDCPEAPLARLSEYFWLSIAREVGIPAPTPDFLVTPAGRPLFATRREPSVLNTNVNHLELASGRVLRGGTHLCRIFAFDLFSGNWDRHPKNYLVIDEGDGVLVVFAIDFSHVTVLPSAIAQQFDPLFSPRTATRAYFPVLMQGYRPDIASALEIVSRLANLPTEAVNAILNEIPAECVPDGLAARVVMWWQGSQRQLRVEQLMEGLQNGTLL